MLTAPPAPSFTTTRFGMTSPFTKLRLDAVGWVTPVFHTVRCEPLLGKTAVTLRTTAVAPAGGTPPRPATASVRVCPGPHGVLNPPVPSRESSRRDGVMAVN